MTARLAVAVLLCLLWCRCVYRAATQSITIDEAFAYNLYLARPLAETFTNFDAANHVLYTLLARLSVATIGSSEFAMRLPTLVAAAAYFIVLYRLSRLCFGKGALFAAAVILAAMHPIVLDFLSLGRGYGLGLALLTWMLLEGAQENWTRAGIAAGLAVAANLIMAFPVAGFLMTWWLVAARGRRWLVVQEAGVTAVIAAALFLVIPLARVSPEQFYMGAGNLWDSAKSIAAVTGAPEWTGWIVPVLLVAAAISWLRKDPPSWLFGGILATFGFVVLAHTVAGVPYPYRRTALYLFPLLTLAAVALAARSRWSRIAGLACFFAIGVGYTLQFTSAGFHEWPQDASMRRIMERLAAEHRGGAARAGVHWMLEPGVNFYRQVLGLTWLEPVDRNGPDGDFSYYVLRAADEELLARRRLSLIYRDLETGVILARR